MPRALVIAVLFLAACAKPARPPVILISVDTLRADRLGRGLTPHLDALARQSIVAPRAWSHCPLTLPSHLSIFTGLLPPEHGVRDNAGYRFDGTKQATLASILRANGYRTGGAVSAYVMRGQTGASAGFEDWEDAIGIVDGAATGSLQRSGRTTAKIAEEWIGARSADEPFFYFLHLYEPHTPWAKSYDADVAEADAIVGGFLDFLKQRGIYDRALIVVLSDHGEGLGDHGEEEHGVFLYREALEVPLLIRMPEGRDAKRIDQAQLIDVLPTILDALGIDAPKSLRGASLLKPVAPRTIYAESLYPRLHLGWSELRSVTRAPMQYIDAPRAELYDLARDPSQRRNLAGEDRRTLHELRAQLASFGATFTAPAAVDAEEAKKLAALGYVSAGAGEAPSNIDPKDRIGDLQKLKQIRTIAEMEALLAANPKWSDVRDRLGIALAKSGDHARAAKVYEEGIVATPKLAPAFALSAATELFELDRNEAAEKHARYAASSGIAEAHLLLGELALARGDLAAAAAEAERASSAASRTVHVLFLQARIASARRDFRGALEILGRAQKEQRRTGASLPRHFHFLAGDSLARLGRMAEAKQAFARAIAQDPRERDPYERLASIYRIEGNEARAKEILAAVP